MRISHLKEKLLFTAAYLALALVLYRLNATCLFQTFLHIPCPGCGMTRAFLAALCLDFGVAFRHHAMFWSMPVLYAYFLFDKGLFRRRWINCLVLSLIALGFLLNWLRLLTESGCVLS